MGSGVQPTARRPSLETPEQQTEDALQLFWTAPAITGT